MSEYLRSTDQFSFRAEVTVDEVLDSGQKLQFERTVQAFVRRPDKIRAEFAGDRNNRRFWYDGKTITLLDTDENVYATTTAPGAIDAALDFAVERFGVSVPLADFVYSNPYEGLTQDVGTGVYVGTAQVRGQPCHHLAFTQETIDWQIWIEDGASLVPRKLSIHYKQVPSQPQYTAVFTHWDVSPRLPDLLFEFGAPAGAEEIEFLTANGEN